MATGEMGIAWAPSEELLRQENHGQRRCGAGISGEAYHRRPSSRMAQTQFSYRQWGMQPTLSGAY
jgi:hypothetical protein